MLFFRQMFLKIPLKVQTKISGQMHYILKVYLDMF